ncbi:MAG: hydratase [Oscillospiraceae bacterium]|jgi:aconitate hydratase|nr:hydratase [Oscillospiraceae bacterium]
MLHITHSGVALSGGVPVASAPDIAAREKTLAYRILRAHSGGGSDSALKIKFDALISHDITYVGIIQTARASGMTGFPVPYALTNCHNSLCAVGGTINEDDHAFGLSAAKRYGGIYVPANQAVIHQYAREKLAKCGAMILGSDSHTRYGCYGAMGVGEGGGELVKQLLCNTYDIDAPEVILVWVKGAVPHGVGPHDAALALVAAAFPDGFAKNKILEFAGPGVAALPMDFRAGIDVMTTETSCLSSIWETDGEVRAFYENVCRAEDFCELKTEDGAYYDALIDLDLSKLESMIALPFHPSKAYTIHELQRNPEKILAEIEEDCRRELGGAVPVDLKKLLGADGKIRAEQGVIVGCAGGMYDNIAAAADILRGGGIGDGYFDLSVYPSSSPVSLAVTRDGLAAELAGVGAVMKPAFCGPCFGAGDTPASGTLSVRHATRNFAAREGSRPQDGQFAAVALMDARSVAATAKNGGVLTAATDVEYAETPRGYKYDGTAYEKRVYDGWGRPDPSVELRFGPNIADWPEMHPLGENLQLVVCAVIDDPVTTTDELIPSGETSSYRSNPEKLAQFTLSRRCPDYVEKAKAIRDLQRYAYAGDSGRIEHFGYDRSLNPTFGSAIYAVKPGDGSAREQAASCQKILGGWANIAREYATKRYRSNLINWGILPFTFDGEFTFGECVITVLDVRRKLLAGDESFPATVNAADGTKTEITLKLENLSDGERAIIAAGCLMNRYREVPA